MAAGRMRSLLPRGTGLPSGRQLVQAPAQVLAPGLVLVARPTTGKGRMGARDPLTTM